MKRTAAMLVLLTTFWGFRPSSGQDYEVSVTNVNVWVKVLDRSGKPVFGMRKDEFEIFEDGKRLSTECFEEVGPLRTESMPHVTTDSIVGTPIAPVNIARRFVLFLDLYNTTQIEFERIRPKMSEFLDQISKQNWEVMLVAYLPSGKLGVVSPFTRDFSRIRALLDQAKGNVQRDQRIARNESEILQTLSILKVKKDAEDSETDNSDQLDSQTPGGTGGSHGSTLGIDQHFFQLAINNAFRQAQLFASKDKQASEHSFGALESFAQYYASSLTSKEQTAMLFVSGGINSDPGRRYFDLVSNFVTRQSDNVNSAEFSASFTGSTRENNFDLEKQIQKSIGKLNRYNITLYAINTRGLVGSGPNVTQMESTYAAADLNLVRDYQDSLSQIAQETGGLSFQNSQNFKVGFDSILDDLSHQYLLCYRPPEHKKEGQYHSIKVVSKRPGVNVRHRLGYAD